MDDISLGKLLLRKGSESPTNTTTITAVAVDDSENGTVTVDIGGEPVEIDTVTSVSAGEEVLVNVSNLSPVGTGVVGWGDRIEDKTQHLTFESGGFYPGLHIHENASDYTVGSDLYLNSNLGLNLMIDEDLIAQFSPSGIYFAETPNQAGIDLNGGQFNISNPIPHYRIGIPYDRQSSGITVNDRSFIDALTELYILCTDTARGSWVDITIAAGVGTESASIKMSGITYSEDPKFTNYTNIDIEARNIGLSLGRGLNINSDPGTSGQVLTSQGAGSPPIWSTPSGGGSATTWYGTSSTAAGTQTKVVTCADFVLEKGAIVTVYFTNANTYGALKLNVNSTGAIAVYHRGTVTASSNVVSWNKKDYVTFQYDGTYWVFVASSGSRVISSKDRLTSANVATNGTGGLNHLICKATTMTTGTPASDGHIIDLDWDANYSQHAQLFLPCVDNQFPQWRMQVNNAWTEWDTFYTAANPPSGCSLAWNQVAQTTNNTAAALDLTGYSEVLIVADALRNSAHHFFSVNVPIQAISSTAAEYKLGGYVGANASTSGGAWCSMKLDSFNGVQLFINNTSFLSSTTWTVYAR